MFNFQYLKDFLIISSVLSIITCAFIQKVKGFFLCSNHIAICSLLVNIVIGIIFCYSFTEIEFPTSIWIGLFSFLGADTIYKTLEGKLQSYTEIIKKDTTEILNENIINKEDINGKTTISK